MFGGDRENGASRENRSPVQFACLGEGLWGDFFGPSATLGAVVLQDFALVFPRAYILVMFFILAPNALGL